MTNQCSSSLSHWAVYLWFCSQSTIHMHVNSRSRMRGALSSSWCGAYAGDPGSSIFVKLLYFNAVFRTMYEKVNLILRGLYWTHVPCVPADCTRRVAVNLSFNRCGRWVASPQQLSAVFPAFPSLWDSETRQLISISGHLCLQ